MQKIGEGSDDIIEGGDTSKCLIHRWLLILRKILMPKLTNERKKEKWQNLIQNHFNPQAFGAYVDRVPNTKKTELAKERCSRLK